MPAADSRMIRMFVSSILLTLVIAITSLSVCAMPRVADPVLRLAHFSADVTIPLGHRCMGILPTKAREVVDPLMVHGWILLGQEAPIVLAAFDWCEIRNDSFDEWRQRLAEAVGTTPHRVIVCSLHQHDAPVIDAGAQRLLDEVGLEDELFSRTFHEDCLQRVTQAAKDSLEFAIPVTHVGIGEAQVRDVASNRRVVHPDGRVDFDRYSSSGGDPFHSAADEGLIDPLLKTISFWNEDKPLIAIHHYAVHPMSYYGRGGVTSDFVGIARERRHRATGVPQVYVSGCSGDVTAGKFNNGSSEMRIELARRIETAMEQAWQQTTKHQIDTFTARNVALRLPFHEGDEFSLTAMKKTLQDETAAIDARILAAMGSNSRQRFESGIQIDVPCFEIGPAMLVLLPGESFVGYQLMAQEIRPDKFVMAIGYGDCWTGYVPTQAAFADGFNHDWRWVGPGSEPLVNAALRHLLQATDRDVEASRQ